MSSPGLSNEYGYVACFSVTAINHPNFIRFLTFFKSWVFFSDCWTLRQGSFFKPPLVLLHQQSQPYAVLRRILGTIHILTDYM